MTLDKIIKSYTSTDILPMHMPGHKRNSAMLGTSLPWELDITEIPLILDHFGEGKDYVSNMERRAAKLFGFAGGKGYISTNGGTGAILAAIHATVTAVGDKVIMARNCHKSIYHAAQICHLSPSYITPEICPDSGISGAVTAEQVSNALAASPDTDLVIITSPTYEGVMSDIDAIAAVVHQNGAILMVDAAHGSHLAIGGTSPFSAADIVVHSLHKTLPALTQTAVLLENITKDHPAINFAASMEMFNSSSPSYPLLASVDQCLQLIEKQGIELFRDYKKMMKVFREYTILENLSVDFCSQLYDFGKVVIRGRKHQISGTKLMTLLRDEFDIELEMASTAYALAMTSICDEEDHFMALSAALVWIDQNMMEQLYIPSQRFTSPTLPQVAMAAHLAAKSDPIALKAKGVASEYVFAYPPGIPLIVPGEVVPNGFEEEITNLRKAGVRVYGGVG